MKAKDDRLLNAFAGGNIIYRNGWMDGGGIVDTKVVDSFRQKVKQSEFESQLFEHFPNWHLTELQKKSVVNRMLKMYSSSELATPRPKATLYADAVMFEVSNNAVDFQCPICMEPLVTKNMEPLVSSERLIDASNMWCAALRKTENWSNQPCGHACCRSCMSMWAETAINEQKLRIKCPAVGCSYSLWQHDLENLVGEECLKRHQEHKNADYLQHLKTSVKEDACLKSWLKSHARPCPECHVIVSRSEGCNDMMCVCGTRFCYACGFKQCKCNSGKNRPDIWNPRGGREAA